MINAEILIKNQKEKEKNKNKIYDKIYELIEKKILSASSCNYYYTVYEIPEFLIGYTLFNFDMCSEYIQKKLRSNKFKVILYQPNILFITWNN